MKAAELKERVLLETVLEHYGWSEADVEGSGWNGWAKTLCPFHDDSEPSASVNLEAQRFNCFACGMRGDILDLVMAERNMTFREAREWIVETFLS